MDQNLVNAALKDGLWALLFVSLYMYQLNESRRNQDEAKSRENKMMTFIDEISAQFEKLARQYEKLSEDVRTIKDDISARSENKRKGNAK